MCINKSILSVAVSIALTACAGGGGGGSGVNPPIAPPPGGGGSGGGTNPPPTEMVNPGRVTLKTDAAGNAIVPVKVGVIDTGFNVNHEELKDVVTDAQDFGGSGTIIDDKYPHGTNVAQVIGGSNVGYSGNVELLLGKVADTNGIITSSTTGAAGEWAIDNGAKIVNLSLGGAISGVSDAKMKGMYDKAVAKDALIVMAAGNNGQNLSSDPFNFKDDSIFAAGNEAYKEHSLIVGALDTNGNLASYSNHAGENKDVQDRFLVAPGDNVVAKPDQVGKPKPGETDNFDGTSSAAPVVSAAAATIRAYWSHMTAKQTADLLLKTADKTFSDLYSKNNCGTSGTENCGYFYFGQGQLDLEAALKPQGTTKIVTGASVDGESFTMASTRMSLPAAFGDAAAKGLNVQAAYFDDLGRDYGFKLANMTSAASRVSFAEKMNSVVYGGVQSAANNGVRSYAAFDGDGNRALSFTEAEVGEYGFSFVSGKGDQVQREQLDVATLSLDGGMLANYDQAHGLGASMKLNDNLKISTKAFTATGADTLSNNSGSAARYESALSIAAGKDTTATIGFAQTADNGTALGLSGKGAMRLSNSVTDSLMIGLHSRLGAGYSAFANAELGRMSMDNGNNGLIRGLDGVKTSQFAMGLAWVGSLIDGKTSHMIAAISQPLRVDAATASLNVPVGRTDDGKVIYEQRKANLTPSGRQINAELAFNQMVSKTASFGFNAVYARDAGHIKGETDWIIMSTYQTRF